MLGRRFQNALDLVKPYSGSVAEVKNCDGSARLRAHHPFLRVVGAVEHVSIASVAPMEPQVLGNLGQEGHGGQALGTSRHGHGPLDPRRRPTKVAADLGRRWPIATAKVHRHRLPDLRAGAPWCRPTRERAGGPVAPRESGSIGGRRQALCPIVRPSPPAECRGWKTPWTPGAGSPCRCP